MGTRGLILLLCLAGTALADPITDAADHALELFRAKGDLKDLAARDDPDPWLVADELCARGEFDAAEAFAKAAPRKDIERLPAYLSGQRGRERDLEVREVLAAATRALRAKEHQEALAAIDAVPPGGCAVVTIRLLYSRGLALRELRQLEESALAFAAAAEGADRLGWLAGEVQALHESGMISFQRSDFRGTLRCWEQRLALETARGSRGGLARTLGNIGSVHQSLGDYATALEYYDQSLKLFEELGDRTSVGRTLGNIGLIHKSLSNYAKALEHYDRSLTIAEEAGDRVGVANTFGNIGLVHILLGDYAKALESQERALRLQEELGDRWGIAAALGNIGLVHDSLGDYVKALEYYNRSLRLKEDLGDRAGVAATLGNIGNVHRSLGDYPKALECQEKSPRLREDVEDRAGVATVVGDIGNIHYSLGDYRRALEFQERSLRLRKKLGDRVGVATTLGNIGAAYLCLGDYPKALAYEERSLELKEELGDRSGVAHALVNIGSVHYSFGDYARALHDYDRALRLGEELGDRRIVAAVFGNMGVVHHFLGDYARALAYQEKSLALEKELGDRAEVARALGNIGAAHDDLGEYPKALEYHESALRLSEELGDQRIVAKALGNMGQVHYHMGDWAKAREYVERARALHARIGALDSESRSLWRLACVELAANQPEDAAARAREAVSKLAMLGSGLAEEEGGSLREQFAGVFGVGAEASLSLDDAAGVAFFLESGRAATLVEGLGGRARLLAAAVPEELRQADIGARAKERVALARYRRALDAGKPVEALWQEVEAGREEIVAVARRSALGAKEALVLYALLQEEAIALLVTPGGARAARLGDTKEIGRAVGALQRAAVRPDERGVAAPPHEGFEYLVKRLRKLVIEPLKLEAVATRLLVSPDGPLSYVPFALLTEREVAYVPSGTTYRMLREEPHARGTRVLALGDPDYAEPRDETATLLFQRGEKLEPLPASREEATAVGDVVLLGRDATVPALLEALSKEVRWRAVHLACHGFVDPERPTLSALALAAAGEDDGYLKCLDVYGMRMPADLVVLSACETAKGRTFRAEGVIGFVRAFMMAGSPRVLASLWKVDDRATQALMERFYEEWKGGKVPAATALKRAQADGASHEEWRHPYFWAAWQLWGLAE